MHKTEENFYKAIIIVAIILSLVIAYFIMTMIRHHRRNISSYKTRIKAEIETLEKERKRIATDIHDELGPILSAVRLQINHLDVKTDEDIAILHKANIYIDDLLSKTRAISYNLLPNTLVRKGLISAVEEYINKLYDKESLRIRFQYKTPISLTAYQEINIYRIIQEVIHNTLKHAQATELRLQIYPTLSSYILNIEDNGIGFDFEEKISNSKGLGLYSLQSRADVLNAKFTVNSQKNRGTYFSFEIPKNNLNER